MLMTFILLLSSVGLGCFFLNHLFCVQILLVLSFVFSLKWGDLGMMSTINSMGLFGFDSMSSNLILLSIWCTMLMNLASIYIFKKNMNSSLFVLTVGFLSVILLISFSVKNMINFYIFFELSLIPTFLLIMKWGYQPERVQASLYMLLYTVCASLPLLGVLMMIYNEGSAMNLVLVSMEDYINLGLFFGVFLMGAFFVKMPLYFVHLWLPKAHVEAPVSGSMILAGVLLKLGSYGLIRIISLWYKTIFCFSEIFVMVSLIGGVLTGLICIVQSDLKCLIAYSSVGHMGVLCAGVLSFSFVGFIGGVIMMIAHGLCSSGMFFLSNVFYQNSKSRSVLMNKGVLFCFPMVCMFSFLIFSCNMSAPPSINLAGELMLSMSIISFSFFSLIPISILVFMAGCYSMYLFTLSCHGLMSSNFSSWLEIKYSDLVCVFLHFFPIWFILLNMKMYL